MGDSIFRTGSAALAAAVAALAALLWGCAGKDPRQTAQEYLDNLKLYNYSACYQMLSHQDRLDRTMDAFLAEPPLAPEVSREWFKPVLNAVSYEIAGVRQQVGNKAVVLVKVMRPDLPLWERIIDAAAGPGASPEPAALKSLDDGSYPKLGYEDEIVTVKESGQWRILVNFPGLDEAGKKHKEAIQAYHRRDYEKAIAAYHAALSGLASDGATGSAGLKFLYQRELGEIERVKSEASEARAYAPKLALSNVEMKMSASHVPGIFGKIKNTGDRAVDEAVCTVTFYAGKGEKRKALYSEEHTIIATPLEFLNFSRPVLPFAPGESRRFGFTLTAPAEIQQKADPSLEITAVAFTHAAAPVAKLSPVPSANPSPAAGAPAGPSAAATAQAAPAGH